MSSVLIFVLPRLPVLLDKDCHFTIVIIALKALEPEFIRIFVILKSDEEMLVCIAVEYQKSHCKAVVEQDVPFSVVLKELEEVMHDFPNHLSNLKIALTFQTPYLPLPVKWNLSKMRAILLNLLWHLSLASVGLSH
jgi:hypothetical protein